MVHNNDVARERKRPLPPAHDQPESLNLTLTDSARDKLKEVFSSRDLLGIGAVRIGIAGRSPRGFDYAMTIEDTGESEPDDEIQDEGDFKIFVNAASAENLRGSTVDYVTQMMGGGFRIDPPAPVWNDPRAAGIAALIDGEINPGVASHGGHVTLIDVKDDVVYVQLGGGCQGCAMVDVTLRQGIEVIIKREFPTITSVVDTTDHAGGSNPYYQPSKGAAGQSPFYQSAKG
jgi:Fe/S biogenesis protein NfuA